MPDCEPSARTDAAQAGVVPVRVVLVVGVAGAGKTTLGRALAARLDAETRRPWAFADADDFHTPDALAAMARGHPLTDADRAPWLDRLRGLVRTHLDAGPDAWPDAAPEAGPDAASEAGPGLVLACSALRAAYRQALHAGDPRVATVWLDAPAGVLAARLAARLGRGEHPVGPSLLPSQLALFEPPDALRLDATRPVGALVAEAVAAVLGTRPPGAAFPLPHPPTL